MFVSAKQDMAPAVWSSTKPSDVSFNWHYIHRGWNINSTLFSDILAWKHYSTIGYTIFVTQLLKGWGSVKSCSFAIGFPSRLWAAEVCTVSSVLGCVHTTQHFGPSSSCIILAEYRAFRNTNLIFNHFIFSISSLSYPNSLFFIKASTQRLSW